MPSRDEQLDQKKRLPDEKDLAKDLRDLRRKASQTASRADRLIRDTHAHNERMARVIEEYKKADEALHDG